MSKSHLSFRTILISLKLERANADVAFAIRLTIRIDMTSYFFDKEVMGHTNFEDKFATSSRLLLVKLSDLALIVAPDTRIFHFFVLRVYLHSYILILFLIVAKSHTCMLLCEPSHTYSTRFK